MVSMNPIYARRLGRIAFGAVLLAGVAALVGGAWTPGPHGAVRFGAARIVLVTWCAALAAGVVVHAIAGRMRWSRAPEALFAASVTVPVAGIALLLPITLHLPVVLLIADARAFDIWVVASLWITGLAHAVFAALCVRRARQLIAGRPATAPRKIYVATLVTSCVPFALLWAIPPVLVALTALPFVPMLHALQRLVDRERAEISSGEPALPRAITVAPRAL
jgi:hypothetical protein